MWPCGVSQCTMFASLYIATCVRNLVIFKLERISELTSFACHSPQSMFKLVQSIFPDPGSLWTPGPRRRPGVSLRPGELLVFIFCGNPGASEKQKNRVTANRSICWGLGFLEEVFRYFFQGLPVVFCLIHVSYFFAGMFHGHPWCVCYTTVVYRVKGINE